MMESSPKPNANSPIFQGTATPDNITLVISSVAYPFLAIAICFGNLLIIIGVFKFLNLQTISNVYVVGLAIADLIIGALVMPLKSIKHIRMLTSTFEKSVIDDLTNVLQMLSFSSSLVILLLIAIERHTAIVYPFFYLAKFTVKKVILSTVVAVVAAVTYQISMFVIQKQQNGDVNVRPDKKDGTRDAIVIGISVIGTTSLYINIALTAKRQKRLIAIQVGSMDKNDDPKPVRRESKTTKMLAIILGTVYICWIPYVVFKLITENLDDSIIKDPNWMKWCGMFVNIFRCMNSLVNPLIYAGMNSDFRRAFLILLRIRKTDVH